MLETITRRTRDLLGKLNPQSKSRFRANFLLMAKANVLARLIQLIAAPILTRLYLPEHFGVAALFSLGVSLLIAFSTLRFEWLIPNAQTDHEATGLFMLAICSLLIFSCGAFGLLYFSFGQVSFWTGFDALGWLVFLIPLAGIGGAGHLIFQSWFVRSGDLTVVGQVTIRQTIGGASVNVACGIAGLGSLGLICGALASQWLGLMSYLHQTMSVLKGVKSLSLVDLRRTLSIYRKQALLSSCVSVVNASFFIVMPLLIVQYYSILDVGYYALMSQLALAPLSLITKSLSQSFWSEAASLVNDDRPALRRKYLKLLKTLAALAIPGTFICLSGPLYVGFLFGAEEWSEAGVVLAALTPYLMGSFVFSSTNHLVVYGRQGYQLASDAFGVVLAGTSVVVCARLGQEFYVAVFFASMSVLLSYLLRFQLHLIANRERPRNGGK